MDFFILGNPRSGTTLLRLILNNHSEIGVPPESGIVQWWYNKYKDKNLSENFDELKNDILSSKKIEQWKLDDSIFEELRKMNITQYDDFFKNFYKQYTQKSIVGDKNNYYIHHINEIKEIYPNTKFIHIIRDGRDVYCSYQKINKMNKEIKYLPNVPNSLEEAALEWSNNNTKILKETNGNQLISLKYEDLITNPEKELSKISSFLGVPFEQEMLDFYKDNNEPIDSMPWKKKNKEKIDSKNIAKFKKTMSDEELRRFNEISYEILSQFDYET